MLLSWAFQKTKVKVHYPKNQRMDSNGNDKHAAFWNKLFFYLMRALAAQEGLCSAPPGACSELSGRQ